MGYRDTEQVLRNEKLCPEYTTEASESRLKATELFEKNIKLAYYVAHHYDQYYSTEAVSPEDIQQVALMALWEVCMNYDESIASLATYAVPYIRGKVLTMLRKDEPLTISRTQKDIKSLLNKYQIVPPLSKEDIDFLLERSDKFTREQLEEYSEISLISIDSTVRGKREGDEVSLSDLIPDKSTLEDPEFIGEENIKDIIDTVMSNLHCGHKDLVEEWLYSVVEGEPLTQQELAVKYNISQSYVSRLRKYASKLLERNKGLKNYLLGID